MTTLPLLFWYDFHPSRFTAKSSESLIFEQVIIRYMKKLLLTIIVFSFSIVFAQSDEYLFESFTVKLESKSLIALDSLNQIVFTKTFLNPVLTLTDLNRDGVDEIILIDSNSAFDQPDYHLFIYGFDKNIFLIDSVYSGVIQPFETEFEELDGTVLVTGDTQYNFFNQADKQFYLPISCLAFDGSKMVLVNDILYDIFIEENEIILASIIDYVNVNGKNCNSSEALLPMIVSAYVNYINAGENSSALQLINNFYYCENKDELIKKIESLMEN